MLGSVKEKLEALASAADAAGTSLHVHHCPGGDWLVFFGEADRVVQFGGQRELLVDTVDEACAKLVSGGGEDLAGAPPDHVAAMEAQTGGKSPNEAVADAMVAAGFTGSRWAATTTNRLGAETPDRVIAHETGGDHPADDPRLHQEAADSVLADELVELVDEFEEAMQVFRANRQRLADDLGLHDRYGAPLSCRDCGAASYLASGMTFHLADGSWVDWPGSGPRCGPCFQTWQPRNEAGMAIAELEARSGSLTAERLAAIASCSDPPIDSPPPGIPRRSYLPGNTPAEIAIRQAMLAVEEMPAHPLLTDAVNLLQQAREKVADFVDGPAPGEQEPPEEPRAPEA